MTSDRESHFAPESGYVARQLAKQTRRNWLANLCGEIKDFRYISNMPTLTSLPVCIGRSNRRRNTEITLRD